MATQELTNSNFESTVTGNDIVLVDFWADWCGPCKRFAPIYDEVSGDHEDVVFGKLDTEANQEIAGALGISSIPTIMAFREGVMVFNQAGLLNNSQLNEVIGKVKELDMEAVHAEVAKLQAEQSGNQQT